MCKKNYLLSFLGFLLLSLFVALQPGFTLESNTTDYATQSNPQTQGNYNNDSEMLQPNLNEQGPLYIDPSNPWDSLRNWINEGMQGLNESAESLMKLENQLAELQTENSEQESLLRQSQELLTNLKQNLTEAQNSVDIAIDRMQDAESYALWIERQNELLRRDVQRLNKSSLIGFSFGGISFGVGIPLIITGIQSDNKTMLWTGVGVIGIGSIIWATGHYLFNWW